MQEGQALLKGQYAWESPYIILLWLSLICKIPFDLAKFDEDDSNKGHESGSSTVEELERIGKRYLPKAGMESQGAALLLSCLYTRYVLWARNRLQGYTVDSSKIAIEGLTRGRSSPNFLLGRKLRSKSERMYSL